MDTIEKIIIGLCLFAVTSVLAYLFKMRQLYVVVPKLYRHSAVSENGTICELIILNRGAQVEHDIQVNIDQELKCELLASSSAELTLEGSTIKVDRLHRQSEISAMLLIENGLFDSTKITAISSKDVKGVAHRTLAEVPPNAARSFMMFVLFLSVLPGMYYGEKTYTWVRAEWTQRQLTELYKLGWSDLATYAESDFRSSYSNGEFPIAFVRQYVEDGILKVEYDVMNKSALPLKVYSDQKSEIERTKDKVPPFFSSVEVPPLTKRKLIAKAPIPSELGDRIKVEFSISSGKEFLPSTIHTFRSGFERPKPIFGQ